jgi:glycerol kinase
MGEGNYLCLDQGGTSSRAMVVSSGGDILSQASQPVDHVRSGGGRVEQPAWQIVESLRQCARLAVAQLTSLQRQQLVACGLVCQRSSLLAWRNDGEPLTPVLSWQDTRAASLLPSSRQQQLRIHELTGLWPNAHFGASKMAWLLQHHKAVSTAAAKQQLRLAPLASFLAAQLLESSPYVLDLANAQRTLLMDWQQQDWSPELLDLFAIPPALLPRIYREGEALGDLLVDDLRLPMTLLSGDQSAAVFSAGELPANTAAINLGTGAFVLARHLGKAANDALLNTLTGCATLPLLVEGTVNGAGSALDWWAQRYGHSATPDVISDALSQTAPKGFFLNTVSGLGSPWWQKAEPKFTAQLSPSEQLYALLESIVFLVQCNLDSMRQRGHQFEILRLSGGLSASDKLCQLLADCSAVAVHRPEEREATVKGMAWRMMRQPLWPKPRGDVFQPSQPGCSAVAARYQSWRQQLEQYLRA